ncbi:MAG: P-loop NTPase [Desulfocapsaceae bacterium]|nr:P-loop NTPase [Desulfocapsaceae bacterium]
MLTILMACSNNASLAILADELSKLNRVTVSWAKSQQDAIKRIGAGSIDVLVVGEELLQGTALSLVKEVIKSDPFINCAVVSPLSPKEFHESTEGLGVFMQLQVNPGPGDAERMMSLLASIGVWDGNDHQKRGLVVSVASGKGGTGKTTVATNLALSLGGDVCLLDCDVEEPNAHLFLNPEIQKTDEITAWVPAIKEDLCTACKACAEICRFRALTVIAKKVLVFPELCHGCGGCLKVCPEGAISDGSRVLGEVGIGRSGGLGFIHGRLRVGEAMSPPLIRRVRSQGAVAAISIIDAPPGTSCPVITAIKGSDFVLLVTEPTPFGLHDLILAVEAVRSLGIPCGIVINRADIGDKRVQEYANKEGLPILMEIPFDRKLAEAYSCGKPFVEVMPEWSDRFRSLYKDIQKLVQC